MTSFSVRICLMLALEVQLKLTFVEDNGVWNYKYGRYAVDGIYDTGPDDKYYHSKGDQRPLLLLKLDQASYVRRVQVLNRNHRATAGLGSSTQYLRVSHVFHRQRILIPGGS